MKLLYLIFHGFEAYNGISKKIHYQVSALKQCDVETHLCYIQIDNDGYQRRMIDDQELENFEHGIKGKIKKWIDYSKILKYIETNSINFIYIRSYHNANPFLISFVKQATKVGVKTLLEIPTYPYDNEYINSSLPTRLQLLTDKLFRRKLAHNIFRIVTFSNETNIFGAKTINISNGIDFDAIKIKEPTNSNPNIITLISVAEIHVWHGFDRLLKGLTEYYKVKQDVEVRYEIVGYGDEREISKLKNYIIQNKLENYVTFHGPQYGDSLDSLFNQASIGIASLGRHRSGITNIKTLKNREYAARGIPFIYSEVDNDFEEKPYIMKVSADESPINILDVIAFYEKVKTIPAIEIRNSITNLSWKNQMEKVILACK
ncbi:glycosyltransferase [uncultured Dysgonomonas sp.]|uniref:glycosyltransferase n=1 Tax=Dysgonomonas mossii TaxID=163665 RepID=UPI0028041A10|nr:glycosyltransferase [uncultured Dysgonomonas sp.]